MDNRINFFNFNMKNKSLCKSLFKRDFTKMKNEFNIQVAYFSQLYENSTEAVAILDNQDKVININKSFTRVFNYTLDEIEGTPINECISDKEITRNDSESSKIVLSGTFISMETLRKCKDGRFLDVKVTVFPIVVSSFQLGSYVIYEDITEQKRTELALRERQEWFKVTLSSIGDGVIATDKEGKIKFMNNVAEELTGYTMNESVGQNLGKVFNIVYGEIYGNIEKRRDCLFSRIINGEITFKSDENICLISKDNNRYSISTSGSPIRNDRKESIGMVVTFQNITERIVMEKKLKKMSLYDSLTDVYNRGYFQDVLAEGDCRKDTNVGMIVCDLDGLKIINDTLGHCFGDELLINAAYVLKKLCKDNYLVARIGGDEFVILLKDCNERDVEELNKELQNEIRKFNMQNSKIHLSIATGTAFNGCNYKPMKDIFKEADNNMYICKLNRKESNRNTITKSLIMALAERDFVMEGHIDRMKRMSLEFSSILGLSSNTINSISLLAQFHDLGKVGISDKVLKKNGALNEEEKNEMRRHCEIGYRIAKHSPDLESIADLILKHHESWEGKGYPMGIRGIEIPLECRIISIIDAYESMTGQRHYKKVMTKDEAIEELRKCSGLQFDPGLVQKFIRYLENQN